MSFTVELNSYDSITGKYSCIARNQMLDGSGDEVSECIRDYLIHKTLDDGVKHKGKVGLNDLKSLNLQLSIKIEANFSKGIRPAFSLNPSVITRMNSANANLQFIFIATENV